MSIQSLSSNSSVAGNGILPQDATQKARGHRGGGGRKGGGDDDSASSVTGSSSGSGTSSSNSSTQVTTQTNPDGSTTTTTTYADGVAITSIAQAPAGAAGGKAQAGTNPNASTNAAATVPSLLAKNNPGQGAALLAAQEQSTNPPAQAAA